MVHVQFTESGQILLYVHPHGAEGDTFDFYVAGNEIDPL